MTTGAVTPILAYRDAPAAIAFLVDAFGAEAMVVAARPNGTVSHSEIRLGPALLCVATARPDRGWMSPADLDGVNQLLYINVADPDAHYRRARRAGAEILMEPANMSYTGREYLARDPEGHQWCFGTYLPGGPSAPPVADGTGRPGREADATAVAAAPARRPRS